MDPKKAIFLIETLANGIDPVSGEVLPDTSPYNNVEVVRALHFALKNIVLPKKAKKTVQEKQNENLSKGLPKNYGLPWDDDSKKYAMEEFNAGTPVSVIAGALARKSSAVISLLAREGALTQEQAFELKVKLGD